MKDFTLIYGCMFSGKTTRLIELYLASEAENSAKLAVKPRIDNRYVAHNINSHEGLQITGQRISKPEELYPLCDDSIKEVYIDEVQFLGPMIYDVILGLMLQGIRVTASGLDKDYLGRDFGPMPALMSLAGKKIALSASCAVCGKPAHYTYRTIKSDDLILVAHSDIYEARCLEHWQQGQ